MVNRSLSYITLCAFFSVLFSCSTPSFEQLVLNADQLAESAAMERLDVETQQFTLLAYVKVLDTTQPVNIYLEGDGKSWATRYRISNNPTPHNPLALKLAASDTYSPNVIYLARPCQFRSRDIACTPEYWTSHRYSEAIVLSINEAITQLVSQYGIASINLIGFSGGGSLAVLVAAMRDDVISLRTIAGNLDTLAFTREHKVSPLVGSINPTSVAYQMKTLPQLHFVGRQDSVVPRRIVSSFIHKMKTQQCAKIIDVDSAHTVGWLSKWPELLKLPLFCM